MLGKKHYKVHIIIWIMHYGHYPEPFIVDHKNRIKDYNYIDNLRLFTKSQNALNVDAVYKGVTFDSDRNKWRAQISINNKTVMLGRYNTREEAELSYEFATINREA